MVFQEVVVLKGVHLTLMIGPVVPVPVGKDVLEALTDVEVKITTAGPSVFRLNFELSTKSPLHTLFMVSGGAGIPLIRVILAATVNGQTEVMIDGVMTQHQVQPGSSPSTSTLTVTGEDLTKVLDYIDLSGIPYPAMPPFARVNLIIAKYAFLGIIPKVIPSVLLSVPNPLDHLPRHDGKDLAYVKALADEVGYVFYHEPGPKPGVSFMYWGPEIKVGTPQPALNTDMDAHTNVDSLSFSFNSESASIPVLMVHNAETKVPIPIPIPNVNPLSPPLGVVPSIPKNIEMSDKVAKHTIPQAIMVGLAKAAKDANTVSANGSLDVLRYGRMLKARKLVGVRGAGHAFNGLYYVESVTSNIKRGEFKQSFALSRNGLLSTVEKVPA
jgi:hypothetical protein